MGMNYYWHPLGPCKECGRLPEGIHKGIHIGKSSLGWAFLVHIHPNRKINCLTDWIERMLDKESEIRDEFGDLISVTSMLRKIMTRGSLAHNKHAEVDGKHCIANSTGTWDLIRGDFS